VNGFQGRQGCRIALPRVSASTELVGQLEAAGVPKDVRVDGKRRLGGFAEPLDEMMKAYTRWPT
jgi:hypothetical protein